jgi:hypothetical protein
MLFACSRARIAYVDGKLATTKCTDDETCGIEKIILKQYILHPAKYASTLGTAYTEPGITLLMFLHLHHM